MTADRVIILVVAAFVGCAGPRDWTHRQTGLLFPVKLGNLQRSPIGGAAKSARGNGKTVSYSSGTATVPVLRITLVPLEAGSEPDLQGVLAEESRDYASSLPPGHGTYRSTLHASCRSEPVSFAYRGLPARSTGWQSGDPIRIGTQYDTEWWLAGTIARHLVVIESHLRGDDIPLEAAGRPGHTFAGADETLRVLFAQLRWPCELTYRARRPANASETAEGRRLPTAKSWWRRAGDRITAILPASPPGKSSSIGVRDVSRRPEPGTYAHARQTAEPHTCRVSVPSFFGEQEVFQAYVEGEDFEASSREQHFARVAGVGYAWIDDPGAPRVVRVIRLEQCRAEYERLMHHPPPRWDNFFIFVEPAAHEPCVPAPRQSIRVPQEGRQDVTDAIVASRREHFDKAVDTVGRMDFALLMPHPSLQDLFPTTQGMASGSGYYVEYQAAGIGAQNESSQLGIGFTAHSEASPASSCNYSIGRDCAPFATTKRGTEIFQNFQMAGSSSENPRTAHYYARVGDALVHLSYLHWRYDASGATGWRSHEFADGELESIFDSLQSATPEDVIRFPGMAMIGE